MDVVSPAHARGTDRLIQQIQAKTLDGLLWIETPAGKPPEATYISKSAGDFMTSARLKDALDHGIVDEAADRQRA